MTFFGHSGSTPKETNAEPEMNIMVPGIVVDELLLLQIFESFSLESRLQRS